MVGEALAPVWRTTRRRCTDTVESAIKKMARAMVALNVAKIVMKGTEPEARLLYRLITMLG